MIRRSTSADSRERSVRALVHAALAAVVLATLAHTRADPDIWGHVAFGRDIVVSRSVPSVDPYSFADDATWINHEWLAELTMYAAYAALGGTGLIGLKILVVVLALILASRSLRIEGVGPPVRELLLAVAVVASIQQLNAVRPQIFSILLFAATLAAIVRVERGRIAAIAWMPAILLVWVNLHGGWIVGAGTLGLWATVRLIESPRSRHARVAFAASAASVAATLGNPYGWEMWRFLLGTVRLGRAEISDWQPIFLMGPGVYLTWVALVALTAVACFKSPERPPVARAVVVLVLAVGAFRVNRLTMFFAFAVVMLLGACLRRALPARDARRGRAAGAVVQTVAAVVALATLGGGLGAAATYGRCILIESERWPEPEAVRFIQTQASRGRMLSWFDWGQYVIWHLAPGIQVSIDGRRETVYSPRVLADHLTFYYDGRNAGAFMEAHQIDYVWLPVSLPVVPLLESQPGLSVLWRGPRSVLFATRPAQAQQTLTATAADPPASRCFPGP